MKKLWVGTSWKMNKTRQQAIAFASALKAASRPPQIQAFVIPPFPYIAEVAAILESTDVLVGAQNMHWSDDGAWTGEISPLMIKDCGAQIVELGHSERRTHFGETDETVALKVKAALLHGLTPLVCIGDTKQEYDQGKTEAALERQVRALLTFVDAFPDRQLMLAYEPVWSIGEGGTPATPEFANAQHRKISQLVKAIIGRKLPIFYGGSVNAENALALATQPFIDGLFIGRAAWQVEGFINIMNVVAGVEK
jgi:L-erythrulose 1-phosphate isomerase